MIGWRVSESCCNVIGETLFSSQVIVLLLIFERVLKWDAQLQVEW